MSSWLMRCLLFEYIIIMIVCICEKNWIRALYWLGGSILQSSILFGMK